LGLNRVAPLQRAAQEKQSHNDRKGGEPEESWNGRLIVYVGNVQHEAQQDSNQRVRYPIQG